MDWSLVVDGRTGPERTEVTRQCAIHLTDRIGRADAKVDGLVYALYGLGKEEVGVVKGR